MFLIKSDTIGQYLNLNKYLQTKKMKVKVKVSSDVKEGNQQFAAELALFKKCKL